MPPTLLVPGSIPNTDEIPINFITNWIKKRMFEYGYYEASLNDRILIIQAMTGSGKSTILPVEIFRILRNKTTPINITYTGQKVICTQPRVLTAIELAKDVSSRNNDLIIGITVGYQTKPVTEKPKAGLIYATLGILARQLSLYPDEQIMKEYKFIIIDEAHERTLNSDIVLLMLYKFYKRNEGNKNLPFLILTSATIDTIKYANYFEVSKKNIFTVYGSTYNIQTIWPKNDVRNIYNSIKETVEKICNNKDNPTQSDVLIFAPGIKEINLIIENLQTLKDNILILKLDSSAVENNTKDYKFLFEDIDKLPKNKSFNYPPRRIIISTAVAETGLTIPTCKYVIDMGFHRSIESYPLYNINGLITKPSTQSRITQRKGRAGRLFNGIFYPMYTEDTFNMLEKQQLPEILTLSNEYKNIHLKLYKLLKNLDISNTNLLDPPSIESFIDANSTASLLGFITPNNGVNTLTKLGKLASNFSFISMEQAKIIFSGFVYNCSILDLVTICAAMNINRSNLFMPANKFKKYMKENNIKYNDQLVNSLNICDGFSLESALPKFILEGFSDAYYYKYKTLICDEFIEIIYILESFIKMIMFYKDTEKIETWCINNCLQLSTLQNLFYERENIIDDLLVNGIDILYNNEYSLINQTENTFMQTIMNIKKCIYEGLKNNIMIYNNTEKCYKTLRDMPIKINSNILNILLQNKLKAMGIMKNNIFPSMLLTDKFIMSQSIDEKIMYDVNINFLSVIDGYISVNKYFGSPHYKYENSSKDIKFTNIHDINVHDLYRDINILLCKNIKAPICNMKINKNKIFKVVKNIIGFICDD